jgi:predicted nuclease with TOPRIM domain
MLETEALALKDGIARREAEFAALLERAEKDGVEIRRLAAANDQLTFANERLVTSNKEIADRIESTERVCRDSELASRGLAERLTSLERDHLRVTDINSEQGRSLQEMRSKINELSSSTQRAERARDAAVTLNRELQEQLTTVKDQVKGLSAERDLLRTQNRTIEEMGRRMDELARRVDHTEQLIIGLFRGRIWRTLSALGAPLKGVIRRGDE